MVAVKNNAFKVCFYYRSTFPDHVRTLQLLQDVAQRATQYGIHMNLQAIDCDTVTPPEKLSSLPCLQRIEPTPSRTIMGSLRSTEEVCHVLGLDLPPPGTDNKTTAPFTFRP